MVIVEPLRELLQELWSYCYDELCDDRDDGRVTGDFWEDCDRLITFLETDDPSLGHRRLVYLGWSLALAAAATIKRITSEDTQSPPVFAAVRAFLEDQQPPPANWSATEPPEIVGPQELIEARYVIVELARALYPDQAVVALFDILDDCLDSYAIEPGGQYRRNVFNWMLVEVVPAAWSCRLPSTMYDFDNPWTLSE